MKFPRFGPSHPVPAPAGPAAIGPIPPGATVVLLVEDELPLRNLFGMALRREGYHVLEASNGVRALDVMAQAGSVDLVVSDVVMPEMQGPALAVKLREQFPDLPFVFVTGYLFSDDLGANSAVLSKPFVREDLIKIVIETIGPPRQPAPATV